VIGSAIGERDEEGGALLEVIAIGLLLLIPLVWTLTVLSDLHRASLGAAAAVNAAATDAARAPSREAAARAVETGTAGALRDHGIDPRTADVTFRSSRWSRGGEFLVRVAVPVSVARAPFLGSVAGPSLWMRATGARRIDPFRSR
jgi:N-acyl-D-aspartate/D-glutamate deacylase